MSRFVEKFSDKDAKKGSSGNRMELRKKPILERAAFCGNKAGEKTENSIKVLLSFLMEVIDLRLEGLKKLSPRVFQDERGCFFESYRQPLYEAHGVAVPFVQDNTSFSKKGTIRGLHFQSGKGQAKLVSCLFGAIWDVAVDIRPSSPTFGQWESLQLDDVHRNQIFIPEGFAHGFCVLSDIALVHYKVSSIYDPKTESAIRWNDPDLAVCWPISNPELSLRDQRSPFFRQVLCL